MESLHTKAQKIFDQSITGGPISGPAFIESELKKLLEEHKQEIIDITAEGTWSHNQLKFSQWFYSLIFLIFKPKMFFNSTFTAIQQHLAAKIQKKA